MSEPISSTNDIARRLLWVEGSDDSAVIQSLCQFHQVKETFGVRVKEGVPQLLGGLSVEIRARKLNRFGIVVDANGDALARWRTIATILRREGYSDVPDDPTAGGFILAGGERRPAFGVWIMPDNGSPGAIEEFAAALVPDGDPLWRLAGETIGAIPPEHRRFPETRRGKAHVHTYLAWQESPGAPMGRAITQRSLDAGAPLAESFVRWLTRLFVDD